MVGLTPESGVRELKSPSNRMGTQVLCAHTLKLSKFQRIVWSSLPTAAKSCCISSDFSPCSRIEQPEVPRFLKK